MASSNKTTISARERARQANARRLAEAQDRIKQTETDLVSFFDARDTAEKAGAEVDQKIERIRAEAAKKIAQAELDQANALSALKERGESAKSIAELTDLTAAEVGRLLKIVRPVGTAAPASNAAADRSDVPAAAGPPEALGSDSVAS